MPSPAASPPRLPNQALRPGKPQQRPVTTPGPVQGLASKRQPLARREAMAPTNLFFDTQPGSVTTDSVQPGTITGDSIAFNTITGQNIVAGSIAADSIAAGSITADKLNVSQLSAITADMGTLTAGTITGATVRTSATNPRVVFDSTGITATNGAGATTFRVDSATGNVTATGGTFTGSSFVGGSFSGGTFTGVTFTGGTFQSSATNPRVWFDTTGIHATNPAGTEVFRVDAATGNLTATGATITGGTFVGSVFETSAANPKVRIDATGIRMTATDGTTTFYADSSTGVLTLGNPAGSKITFDPALAANQRLYLEGRLVGTGTIMGPSFETGINNPRMVIDQFGIRAYPPGTFPSAALKDDFNRANTGPPPSGSWLADFRGGGANAFKIVSSRAVPSFAAGDNESGMYWNVLTTTSDHEVFCDVNVEADLELWARISWVNPSGVTAYVCEYTASDHSLRVQRYGPGGPGWYTDISEVVTVGFTAGMSIGIRVVGQSITLFHRAAGASVYSQVLQVTDAAPPHPEFEAGDKWGLMCWEMTPGASPLQIDNVGGGDYVPTGGGTPSFAVDTASGSMSMEGGEITAGLLQTDDENPRIVMDTTVTAGVRAGRLRGLDSGGAEYFGLRNEGVFFKTSVTGNRLQLFSSPQTGPDRGDSLFTADVGSGGSWWSLDSGIYGLTAPGFGIDCTVGEVGRKPAVDIIGALVRTAGVGDRIEFGPSNGLRSISAGGTVFFSMNAGTSPTIVSGVLQGTTTNSGVIDHSMPGPGEAEAFKLSVGATILGDLRFDSGGNVQYWGKAQIVALAQAATPGVGAYVAPYARSVLTTGMNQQLFTVDGTKLSYLNLVDSALSLEARVVAGTNRRILNFQTAGPQVNLESATQSGELNALTMTVGQVILRMVTAAIGDRRLLLDSVGFRMLHSSGNNTGLQVTDNAASYNWMTVPSGQKFRVGEGSLGATQPVDVVNGYVVAYGGTLGSGQAFNIEAGIKGQAAAASVSIGYYVSPRVIRTDSVGGAVTPASVTLGTPFLAANNNSQVANTQRAMGFQFTFISAAAGSAYVYTNCTVN